jgi:hypothetical protein
MRGSVALALGLTGTLALGACGAGVAPTASTGSGAGGLPVSIRTLVTIAAEPRSEPIATGHVMEGSTIGGAPFCAGGTIVDSHGSPDPAVRLIVETITCPEGTLTLAFTPDESIGTTQGGSWLIVGGSGAYDGLTGKGDMEAVYDADPDAPTHVTFSGIANR